jgi:tetratricopeptide (TPR) repeat protein
LEKALEIKRRAQRSIQNGDLDGALGEYEKLVALPDCDPYNFVLLADLLFKRGDQQGAVDRYLSAASAYENTSLYKNAIAVCKKMMRLGLSPALVLERLAHLHALDGLVTEASLYYQQFADHLLRDQRAPEAAGALRKAYEATPDELGLLERMAEILAIAGDPGATGMVLAEAAFEHQKLGHTDMAAGLKKRAEEAKAGSVRDFEVQYLLRSGQQPEPVPPPPLEETEDDDVPAHPGPPLLPGLRDEGEGEIERFPAHAGEVGLSRNGAAAEEEAKAHLLSAAEIEAMLQQAQAKLRAGEADEASRLLTEAAQAYEAVGRYDNAGTIYRGLGKSQSTSSAVLEMWLANAQRRDDKREAAIVACELGDRAIQAGDVELANHWFGQAQILDENNLLAQRRLQRLAEMKDGVGPPRLVSAEAAHEEMAPSLAPAHADPPRAPAPVAPAPAPEPVAMPEPVRAQAPAPVAPMPVAPRPVAPMPVAAMPAGPVPGAPATPSPGSDRENRVELAVGRSEAVTFDLGALLSEFQRGIEAQLSGDAQGHYDLAMAYREMGLLDHAIESFRMALASPGLSHRAAEMLGRCLLDQGRFDEAVSELSAALERPGLDAEGTLGLRYLLALAFEAAGRARDALAEFERVFAEQPNYHDVGPKLRDLRKALESA